MKGPDHDGYVAQRQSLETTVAQRTFRLPLEIDNHKILASKQQLAKPQVAVAAGAPAREPPADERPQPLEQLLAARQHLECIRLCLLGQAVQIAHQVVHRPLVDIAHRLIERALV
jgi:hypothetical protein